MSDEPDSHPSGFGALFLLTASVVVPLYLCALVSCVLWLARLLADPDASPSNLRIRIIGNLVNLLEQPGQWLLERVGAVYPGVYPTVLLEWLLIMAFNGILWTLALVCVQICLVRPILRKRAKTRRLDELRQPRSVAVPWSH